MIALIRRWLKRRRNSRCALGYHYWIIDNALTHFSVTRCSNCGVSYRTF
jgi:hypothetical protein